VKLRVCINCIELTVQSTPSSMWFFMLSAYFTIYAVQKWW
jgi:hypothetical protein